MASGQGTASPISTEPPISENEPAASFQCGRTRGISLGKSAKERAGRSAVVRRRWLVAGALAALGLETLRASIDVVNRLPNWALFGGSGAILLTAGFVLLIKREAWNAWSRRALSWWVRL